MHPELMKTPPRQYDEHSGSDVRIVTSGGRSIPVNSFVLGSASPVLEHLLDRPRKRGKSDRIIPILGVPCDAVVAFVEFVYSSKCSDAAMEAYGIHLLVLSHVFMIRSLKRACEGKLVGRLTTENVVDVFQLAKLCDAPYLQIKCVKTLANNFQAVEQSEGWRFLQKYDPWLELELLKIMEEMEARNQNRTRWRSDKHAYLFLCEAMDCLEHICMEGCTKVGPRDGHANGGNRPPCRNFHTCERLQHLLRHYGTCGRRVRWGCPQCKILWQLLRLHASTCEQDDGCRVPTECQIIIHVLSFQVENAEKAG